MTFRRVPWKGQAGGTERGRKSMLSGTGAPWLFCQDAAAGQPQSHSLPVLKQFWSSRNERPVTSQPVALS